MYIFQEIFKKFQIPLHYTLFKIFAITVWIFNEQVLSRIQFKFFLIFIACRSLTIFLFKYLLDQFVIAQKSCILTYSNIERKRIYSIQWATQLQHNLQHFRVKQTRLQPNLFWKLVITFDFHTLSIHFIVRNHHIMLSRRA